MSQPRMVKDILTVHAVSRRTTTANRVILGETRASCETDLLFIESNMDDYG
jgi:hypothetical protein